MSNTIPLPEPVRTPLPEGALMGMLAIMDEYARAHAAAVSAADNAALREHLGNLLAVLHGDGGHYEAEHGTDKAVADALTRFYGNIMAADSKITSQAERIKVLEEALRGTERELQSCQSVIHLAGGFDPAYVLDAQPARAALGDKTPNASMSGPQRPAKEVEDEQE